MLSRSTLYIQIFFCTFFITAPVLTYAQSDTIYWKSNYQLKWEDFEQYPDTTSLQGAYTHCNISYKSYYDNNDKLKFTVTCFFNKSKSWTKHKDSKDFLQHEQSHFNIAELFARKLRKELDEHTFNDATAQKDVNTIFKKIIADKKAYNSLYDSETKLSKNKEKQELWDKKIMTEIEALSAYTN